MEFFHMSGDTMAIIFGDYKYNILKKYDEKQITDNHIYSIGKDLYILVSGEPPLYERCFAEFNYNNGRPHFVQTKPTKNHVSYTDILPETLNKFGFINAEQYEDEDDVGYTVICECELCQKIKPCIKPPNVLTRYGDEIILETQQQIVEYDISDYEESDYEEFSENDEDEDDTVLL